MCGISVVIGGTQEEVTKMGTAISHRGVMNSLYENEYFHVYYNWLPITDKKAHPCPYEYGDYKVWLNGYISNWKELAKKYDIDMMTSCDSELLVKFLYKFKGGKLDELNGFFAVVYWDGDDMVGFTDRYGIKQLYKYETEDKTYICSEVKGLKAVVDLEVVPEALDDWEYSLGVMNRHTIYKNVERVDCLPFYKPQKIEIDYEEAKLRLADLLYQSCKRNKVENTPDCVFLSGGIDSGVIAQWIKPQYSFSVDYQDENLSEIENIKHNSYGNHYTIICNDSLVENYSQITLDALDDLKAGSCYTNYAITEMASNYALVNYSGAGGDEVFNGYTHRYDKDINDVVKRTSRKDRIENYWLTHKEYDWRFLKAVLVVEDRMSGWHTMETRYPLLDNDLVDFALSLPDEYLENKRILKDISGLHPDVIAGKKKGFSNPHFTNDEWAKHCIENLRE